MISKFSRSHQITKIVSKWFGLLFGVLCVVGWVMLFRGNIEIDLELSENFQLNGYMVIVFFVLVLALIQYVLSFFVIFLSLFAASIIKAD